MRSAARLVVVLALLVLAACRSEGGTRAAFNQLNDALPSEWQRNPQEPEIGDHSARYDAIGNPYEVASVARTTLVAKGFELYDGSGLPDPSITRPSSPQPAMPSGETPADLGPPPTTDPPPVDAIQIRGFRGEQDLGMMRSVLFHPGPRQGRTVVVVSVSSQD